MTDEQKVNRWSHYQALADQIKAFAKLAEYTPGEGPELVAALHAAEREAVALRGRFPAAACDRIDAAEKAERGA